MSETPVGRAAPADRTTITRLVFADQTNHLDTLFGGDALEAMASAASISAGRRARQPVVLAATGAIDFVAPVRLGSIIEVTAEVEGVGRTSLTIRSVLHAEELLTGERQVASTGHFVFVAVDEQGRPVPVPAEARPAERTRLDGATRTTELVRPGHTNHHQSLFGGEMMAWCDAIAFIAATRFRRLPLVTARSEGIDFRSPIRVGEVIELEAFVAETRRTSFVVEVRASVEGIASPRPRLAAEARFVFAPERAAGGAATDRPGYAGPPE